MVREIPKRRQDVRRLVRMKREKRKLRNDSYVLVHAK